MPIDAQIPLGVQMPQIQSPQQVQQQHYTLQNLAQQGQIGQQTIQDNQLKIASQQRTMAGRTALQQILSDHANYDPQTGDPNNEVIAQKLSQAGFGEEANAYLKMATDNSENVEKLRATIRDHANQAFETLGGLAASASSAQDFQAGIAIAAQHGIIPPDLAHQYLQQADAAGPDGWQALRSQAMSMAPSARAAAQKIQEPALHDLAPGASLVQTGGGQPGATGTPSATVVAAGGGTPTESKSLLVDGKPTEVVFDPRSRKYFDTQGNDLSGHRIAPVPPASMMINQNLVPSGDALSMAARKYLATGELPAMGMGQAGAAARVAVMNEAARMDPQAGLAQNAATFKADSGSLKNVTQTLDTLTAFENTAGKNLDQFTNAYQKLADTGSPLLNRPIRTLQGQALGDPNVAAANAAAAVALREIARVTNDPKLSGSLTDSARQEVSSLVPAGATMEQLAAVVKVLRADMGNVRTSLSAQKTDIQNRLGGNPAKPTAPAPAATATAPKEGDTKPIDGYPGTEQTFTNGKWIRTK